MDSIITSLVYLAGTIFVVMFAVRYFNNKPTDRSYEPRDAPAKVALSQDPRLEPVLPKYLTEKSRFNIYQGAFVLFTVVLYYIVSLVFPALVSTFLGRDIDASYQVALVLGTLAFINLSPKIPHIKETLRSWKNDLHTRADIPDRAESVFNILRYNEINKFSPEFKALCSEILDEKVTGHPRRDIDKGYFSSRKDRIERKWARLVYLMHAIERWSESHQFKRHLKSESLKWLALHAYYRDNLIPKMERYREGDLSEEVVIETKKEIDTILIKTYWLVTLLLFMANKVAEDPCIHLKKIGWIVSTEHYFKFSSRQIVFSGSVVFVSILLGAGLGAFVLMRIAQIDSTAFTIKPAMIFYWLVYGIPMYVVPLAVTLFIKRYMSINDKWAVKRPEDLRESFTNRPWDTYFTVSLFSYLVTVSLLVCILSIVSLMKPIATPNPIAQIAVYSGLAFITSAFICYLIDTPSPGWETSWRYYLKGIIPSLLQGSLNVAMIIFAFLLFREQNSFDITSLEGEEMGRLIVYSVIGFVIGMAIYFTSRINTKFYERREGEVVRSSDGWWTIYIDSTSKRVRTMKSDRNHLEVIVDEELKELAQVGDIVEFHDREGLAMTGTVDEVDAETIEIAIPPSTSSAA